MIRIKHYTEEGNYDMCGLNFPVFFIRDANKFPDLIHSHKRKYVISKTPLSAGQLRSEQ